jgi:hypothetical protein
MSLTITQFRDKLIARIISADSGKNVCRYIEAAVKALKSHKVNDHIVSRFLQKADRELIMLEQMHCGHRQRANIRTARSYFDHLGVNSHKIIYMQSS